MPGIVPGPTRGRSGAPLDQRWLTKTEDNDARKATWDKQHLCIYSARPSRPYIMKNTAPIAHDIHDFCERWDLDPYKSKQHIQRYDIKTQWELMYDFLHQNHKVPIRDIDGMFRGVAEGFINGAGATLALA